MNYQSLLIVTYGRSGSTLLQGLLNDIDGILIKGENYNFCFELFQSYKSLLHAAEKAKTSRSGGGSPTSPWFGSHGYDLCSYKRDLATAVKSVLVGKAEGVECYGFKEIRYSRLSNDDLMNYLYFLEDIFPEVGIVFCVRDIKDVLKSGWRRGQEYKETKKRLLSVERNFKEYAEGKENCFIVDYADMVAKTDRLKALYEFVGAPYVEMRVDQVLSVPHSYNQSEKAMARIKKLITRVGP